jgi:hypothetical protein
MAEQAMIEDRLDQAISGLEQCGITMFYAHGAKFQVSDLRAAQRLFSATLTKGDTDRDDR